MPLHVPRRHSPVPPLSSSTEFGAKSRGGLLYRNVQRQQQRGSSSSSSGISSGGGGMNSISRSHNGSSSSNLGNLQLASRASVHC